MFSKAFDKPKIWSHGTRDPVFVEINFALKSALLLLFFIFRYVFQRVYELCTNCGKKAFSILLEQFYLIIKLLLPATAPLTTKTSFEKFKNSLNDFLLRFNVFCPLFYSVYGTNLLELRFCLWKELFKSSYLKCFS